MKTAESQALPAPPSLMAALMAGFDAITNHVELILFPVALDLLLWLGPHLRLSRLIEGFIQQMVAMPGMDTPEAAEVLSLGREIWLLVAERLNLFTVLRSYPVGIPSLMVSRQPIVGPLGTPTMWEIPTLGRVVGLWLILTMLGLIGGTLFFMVVSQAVLSGEVDWYQALSNWPWASSQVLLLALFWVVILIGISIPGSCLISLISLGGQPMGSIGIFLYMGIVVWFLFPLVFSSHGIFVKQRKMWVSVREGIRLTRSTVVSTGLLFLVIVVFNEGLDVLWRVPAEVSWLTAVGLAGHGFVTTALLAASFVYYRDADLWVQDILQRMKRTSTT